MARTPEAAAIARRAAERASVQSWTRCRIPPKDTVPYCLDPMRDVLAKAAGYVESVAGRNIDDPDEVVVVSHWLNMTSLNAFIASPGYASYFKTLGIEQHASFEAFFILEPSMRHIRLYGKMTTYTMSFQHPVNPERRHKFNCALGLPLSDGFREDQTHQAWVSKPQLSPSGQWIDVGVLVQRWPQSAADPTLDIQSMVSNDQDEREEWERWVDLIEPLLIEEVTWDMDSGLLSPLRRSMQQHSQTMLPTGPPPHSHTGVAERSGCDDLENLASTLSLVGSDA